MAHYIFVVNVRTDDHHMDAPDAQALRNEILSNLQYDAYHIGIQKVTVREVNPAVKGVPVRDSRTENAGVLGPPGCQNCGQFVRAGRCLHDCQMKGLA